MHEKVEGKLDYLRSVDKNCNSKKKSVIYFHIQQRNFECMAQCCASSAHSMYLQFILILVFLASLTLTPHFHSTLSLHTLTAHSHFTLRQDVVKKDAEIRLLQEELKEMSLRQEKMLYAMSDIAVIKTLLQGGVVAKAGPAGPAAVVAGASKPELETIPGTLRDCC